VVCNWKVPDIRRFERCSPDHLRAAMWVSVCEGQKLALLEGWRDLRDGSRASCASLATAPDFVETASHTSLEVLQCASWAHRLGRENALAILVDESSIDPDDANRWSPVFASFAQALHDRQIRFDVLPVASAGVSDRRARYLLAVALPAMDAGDTAADRRVDVYRAGQAVDAAPPLAVQRDGWTSDAFASWIDDWLRDHVGDSRVVALEPGGALASDVYIRTARSSDGSARVALISLSPQARSLSLVTAQGQDAGWFRDEMIPGRPVVASTKIGLGPWQVRLLGSCAAVGAAGGGAGGLSAGAAPAGKPPVAPTSPPCPPPASLTVARAGP
jgi:hypothetical protein